MTRIPGVSDAEAGRLLRAAFASAKKRTGGKVPEPMRLMAHAPPTLWAYGLYELASGRASSLPARLKTLAQIKAASMIGCVF